MRARRAAPARIRNPSSPRELSNFRLARALAADREYLHAAHQSYTRPPIEVVAQCVVAFFACTWGIVSGTPKLKPIRITGTREMKCAPRSARLRGAARGSARAAPLRYSASGVLTLSAVRAAQPCAAGASTTTRRSPLS